ncbi:MAG: hypothetical protein MMC33_003920 [Icmadophila ericetorum]|nr:hypothetical protein [Icmadophila ericetorum]
MRFAYLNYLYSRPSPTNNPDTTVKSVSDGEHANNDEEQGPSSKKQKREPIGQPSSTVSTKQQVSNVPRDTVEQQDGRTQGTQPKEWVVNHKRKEKETPMTPSTSDRLRANNLEELWTFGPQLTTNDMIRSIMTFRTTG